MNNDQLLDKFCYEYGGDFTIVHNRFQHLYTVTIFLNGEERTKDAATFAGVVEAAAELAKELIVLFYGEI